jgi:NAD(P)H dehydrogenase (quinone)
MSIVVTGATGHLGRLVVESLLDRGVPADQISPPAAISPRSPTWPTAA